MAAIRALIENYIACYNQMDIDGMLECVTDDVAFENISNNGESMHLQGKDAMRQIAELGMNAFSYRRQSILKLICDAETSAAAAEIKFTGVAALNLPNGVKQGETIELHGASIFEVREGLLCRVADIS